ncbi:Protein of unknown function [Marinobacter persicus]|uniref:DUF1439 domain-containing protein n=1 Tax=Marinobacter persicus TaxID=930118 RepID=A0A1I3U7S5_9GAMM|nr:DUF1439 domain-containing protein [Marinobacter persicus]GHD54303.1 hypothetical protein GCM10008110_28690 [Marinobacter persicus]SFJ79574.1 Protein of unknown function [Marinobacter persicus]
MTQRRLTGLLLLAITVLISGCASLSPYSVSEAQIERHLQDAVADFDRQQLNSGSPLSLSLSDADITLGPDGRDVAVIDLRGQVALNALMTKLPVDIALKLEGAPVYDSEEKAVYIRRLNLLESSIESPFFKGDLAPVTDSVMRVVAQMLETMPVYRLDDSDMKQRMFGMVPMDIRVAPGRLEFVMDE